MNQFNQARYARRKLTNTLTLGVSILTVAFALTFLAWILWTLFSQGFSHLTLDVFTKMTPPPGSKGGLLNAIVGSILMVLFATLIGTPIGVLAGTYLAEYGKSGWLAPTTRFINDILLSAPSIVIGLFIYEVAVHSVGHFSGWAGSLALSLIVIPVVVRTTENMMLLVPNTLREAAAALGAPYWKVVMHVVYKSAKTGIITGLLLAIARITGETAPLLFTALNSQFWNTNMNEPMASVAVVIFQFAMSPYEDWQHLAWAGALLITLFVLGLNILARSLFRPGKSNH